MAEAFDVELPDGDGGRAVEVRTEDGLEAALEQLHIAPGPVVVLLGGARIEPHLEARIQRFLAASLLPAVAGRSGIVVDGGTDAGVMRFAGEARSATGLEVPMIGVAPTAKVLVEGSAGSTALARGHTHFVLVPGHDWGDEGRWIRAVANRLSGGRIATVLVNGGPIAVRELRESLGHGRPALVVSGTGRAADALAARLRTQEAQDPGVGEGELVAVDVTIGTTDLADALFDGAQGGHR